MTLQSTVRWVRWQEGVGGCIHVSPPHKPSLLWFKCVVERARKMFKYRNLTFKKINIALFIKRKRVEDLPKINYSKTELIYQYCWWCCHESSWQSTVLLLLNNAWIVGWFRNVWMFEEVGDRRRWAVDFMQTSFMLYPDVIVILLGVTVAVVATIALIFYRWGPSSLLPKPSFCLFSFHCPPPGFVHKLLQVVCMTYVFLTDRTGRGVRCEKDGPTSTQIWFILWTSMREASSHWRWADLQPVCLSACAGLEASLQDSGFYLDTSEFIFIVFTYLANSFVLSDVQVRKVWGRISHQPWSGLG